MSISLRNYWIFTSGEKRSLCAFGAWLKKCSSKQERSFARVLSHGMLLTKTEQCRMICRPLSWSCCCKIIVIRIWNNICLFQGFPETVQILLEAGAHINWQQTAGETALMKVSGLPNYSCVVRMTKLFDDMNVFDTSQVSKQKLKMKNTLIGENTLWGNL